MIDLIINIINGRVWIKGQLENIGISIENGKITKILKQKDLPEADKIIDANNNIVFPGCVDVHSHLRDSEFSYKEDFTSGTSAAVAGGFTTVLDMPNTNPPIINSKELLKRQNKAKDKIFCNIGFYCSPINKMDIKQLIRSNAVGFKIFLHKPFENQDLSEDNLINIMNEIKQNDGILAIHAEDPNLFDNKNNHTVESEVEAIHKIIELAEKTKCKIHIVHVSTKEGIDIIKRKRKQIDISCEATPHHMILNTTKIETKTHHCEPPLRNTENQKAIFENIINGNIDIIGTDHAPHSSRDKEEGKPGFPGLEITMPLMIDLFNKKEITLQRIYEVLVENPIKRFKLKNIGKIKEGYNADLIIINENKKNKINIDRFFSKAKNSPFDKMEVNGEIMKTIVNGHLVFNEGNIVTSPGTGKILQKSIDFI